MKTSYWQWVTHHRHMDTVALLAATVQRQFPTIWQELEGLSDGLGIPLEQVLAWNFRGDILPGITETATTFLIPGEKSTIAHNQDGPRELREHCFMAEIRPDQGPVFANFCLPGSLPGGTFGVNTSGIVVVNNGLCIHGAKAATAKNILGRSALSCLDLESIVALISRQPECGGNHLGLGQAGRTELHSLEFGYGHFKAQRVRGPLAHTNHALYLGLDEDHQTITPSSAGRHQRAQVLLENTTSVDVRVMRDETNPEVAIHRTALDDPDGANTLATVLFQLGESQTDWKIYAPHCDEAVHTGAVKVN